VPPCCPIPKTAGGSASPKGEARRERAGKAERSECRARHAAHSRESDTRTTVGVGDSVGVVERDEATARGVRAGGVNKPYHAANSRPAPTTPAAAQAVRCHPSQTLAPALAPAPALTLALALALAPTRPRSRPRSRSHRHGHGHGLTATASRSRPHPNPHSPCASPVIGTNLTGITVSCRKPSSVRVTFNRLW